jgi:plasmid stabilization system protein ParE
MRLRYTLPALADLTSILDYVADRSPKGAARIHSRIRDVMDDPAVSAGWRGDRRSAFGASRRHPIHI